MEEVIGSIPIRSTKQPLNSSFNRWHGTRNFARQQTPAAANLPCNDTQG
jgi:hypothetical protein